MQIRHYSCWELILKFFLFFPAFPRCIRAHQVCQLAPAGPVGSGALHWLWENIPAMEVLRLWVTEISFLSLSSFIQLHEHCVAFHNWEECIMGMKVWESEKGQVLDSSFCSLALWFANINIVLFCLSLKAVSSVGVGHKSGNSNYTPWLAFGGLTLSTEWNVIFSCFAKLTIHQPTTASMTSY